MAIHRMSRHSGRDALPLMEAQMTGCVPRILLKLKLSWWSGRSICVLQSFLSLSARACCIYLVLCSAFPSKKEGKKTMAPRRRTPLVQRPPADYVKERNNFNVKEVVKRQYGDSCTYLTKMIKQHWERLLPISHASILTFLTCVLGTSSR